MGERRYSMFDEKILRDELDALHASSLHIGSTWRFIMAHKDVEAYDVPDLPSRVRTLFRTKFKTLTSSVHTRYDSSDGRTTKLLITFQNGSSAEAVIIRHDSSAGKYAGGPRTGAARATLCVSSQVGCKMGCTFCATGTMGFKGNLSAAEIVEQLVHAFHITSIRNVVFMGMGEPMNNYSAVVQAIKTMTGRCFHLSPKHITVSTSDPNFSAAPMASGEGQSNPSTSGDAGGDHNEDYGNEYGPPLPTQEELREMEHRRLVGEATNMMLNFAKDPNLAKYMTETTFQDVHAQKGKKRSKKQRHRKSKKKVRKSKSRRVDDSSTEDTSTDSSDSEDGHFYANKKNFYKANQYDFLEDKSKKVREFKGGGESIKFDTFLGYKDASKALSFIQQFDIAFAGGRYSEHSKIRRVASYFKGNARRWWSTLLLNKTAPLKWLKFKKLFISSWLTQEYERDIRAAWNHLRMTKRDTGDAYCERFWSAFLPASCFKKMSFREQIERFTLSLPTEIRDHCLEQESDCVGIDPNTMDESSKLCRAWGKVKDQEALIFFDGGTKANFISLELAARLEISPDRMGPPAEAVLAAPDRDVTITLVIGKLRLHCQVYLGHEDFYIMPLEGCDVLLGIPWYNKNNAVVDYRARKATLTTEKGRSIVLDIKLKGESVPIVSASAIPKFMKTSLFVYSIFLKELSDNDRTNMSTLDKERQDFLHSRRLFLGGPTRRVATCSS
ncbi:hypothetical protein L7F22_038215 [Adiantum nelumboides]|nr:hypothetical protein [Adiantum nelumboides]